jgi:muramoyltetrapeptide carboxypeptidase
MVQPDFLLPGDTIGIIALGRKIDHASVQASIDIFNTHGFSIRVGKNLFTQSHSYFSGSDQERKEDLQLFLDDPSVKAIVCARGGYGTTRIIDQLDFSTFIRHPKWICGFSDVTALHLKLHSLGVKSIHSTMPVLFSKRESQSSVESLIALLKGNAQVIQAVASSWNRAGDATAPLVGGNLSLIADSLGTSSEIETEGKILLIEEVDEYFYKIDRMMVQLKRAKKFHGLAALVVGYMTDIKETELPFGETFYDIVLHHTSEFDFPIAFNFPFGHENPNLGWVQGGTGMLSVSNERSVLQC